MTEIPLTKEQSTSFPEPDRAGALPFARSSYSLPRCILRRLNPDQAALFSRELPLLDPWLHLGSTSGGMLRYLTTPDAGTYRFAIEADNQPTGVVVIRFPWLLGPFLELIAVRPSCRGLGLGQAVLRWMEEESLPESGNLWVTVSDFNSTARRFYERMGFLEVGPLDGLVREGFTEILLRKRLR